MENKVAPLTEYEGIVFKRPIKREEDQALVKYYIMMGRDLQDTVDEFYDKFTKKQIIGKLVAYGVYVKQDEEFKVRIVTPTKKDYIERLEKMLGVSGLEGLMGAKKETLEDLVKAIQKLFPDPLDEYAKTLAPEQETIENN